MGQINICCIPSKQGLCTFCVKEYDDIVCHIHVLSQCVSFNDQRSLLWDIINETLEVTASVGLFNLSDQIFTNILLGKQWNGFSDKNEQMLFYYRVSKVIVNKFKCGISGNYHWFRC